MLTQKYLQQKGNSLSTLFETHRIRSNTHPSLPIVVLNYDNVQSSRNDPLVCECRGLILEVNSWKIVGRGMVRFFNMEQQERRALDSTSLEENVESKSDHFNDFSLEVKEDGTYIHLFCYEGEWMIATRNNFCEDKLNSSARAVSEFLKQAGVDDKVIPQTYSDLFIEACGGFSMNDLARYAQLDPSFTYCIEMCSPLNQIIQWYENPTLFLLTVVDNQTGHELSISEVDSICLKIRRKKQLKSWKRPKRFENFSNVEQANQFLKKYVHEQGEQEKRLKIEGFIMRDKTNQRLKLKNPFYLLIHKLKYRGWIQAKPEILIPFILLELDTCNETISLLSIIMKDYYECSFEMEELERRFNYCKGIVMKEYQNFINAWNEICKQCTVEDTSRLKELRDRTKLKSLIDLAWQEQSNIKSSIDVSQLFKNNDPIIIQTLFTKEKKEYDLLFLDDHSNHYCIPNPKNKPKELNGGLAKKKPYFNKSTSTWHAECYCGKPMTLKRLKRDYVQYRKCNCGKKFNYHTYRVGTLLWICSDYPNCLLNHEAHQRDEMFDDEKIPYEKGQPLGIPCSEQCKIYRLQIHEIMNRIIYLKQWKMSQCYQQISEYLNVPKSQTHVALFNIETNLFVIEHFLKDFNVYTKSKSP